jgi:hypothetical protein
MEKKKVIISFLKVKDGWLGVLTICHAMSVFSKISLSKQQWNLVEEWINKFCEVPHTGTIDTIAKTENH